jgi:hypothetical protein
MGEKRFRYTLAAYNHCAFRTSGTTTKNASGESSASAEAISRAKTEQSKGLERVRIDTRSGQEVPLTGADAVDAKAGPYDQTVMRDKNGSEVVLDEGAKVSPVVRRSEAPHNRLHHMRLKWLFEDHDLALAGTELLFGLKTGHVHLSVYALMAQAARLAAFALIR